MHPATETKLRARPSQMPSGATEVLRSRLSNTDRCSNPTNQTAVEHPCPGDLQYPNSMSPLTHRESLPEMPNLDVRPPITGRACLYLLILAFDKVDLIPASSAFISHFELQSPMLRYA